MVEQRQPPKRSTSYSKINAVVEDNATVSVPPPPLSEDKGIGPNSVPPKISKRVQGIVAIVVAITALITASGTILKPMVESIAIAIAKPNASSEDVKKLTEGLSKLTEQMTLLNTKLDRFEERMDKTDDNVVIVREDMIRLRSWLSGFYRSQGISVIDPFVAAAPRQEVELLPSPLSRPDQLRGKGAPPIQVRTPLPAPLPLNN